MVQQGWWNLILGVGLIRIGEALEGFIGKKGFTLFPSTERIGGGIFNSTKVVNGVHMGGFN